MYQSTFSLALFVMSQKRQHNDEGENRGPDHRPHLLQEEVTAHGLAVQCCAQYLYHPVTIAAYSVALIHNET